MRSLVKHTVSRGIGQRPIPHRATVLCRRSSAGTCSRHDHPGAYCVASAAASPQIIGAGFDNHWQKDAHAVMRSISQCRLVVCQDAERYDDMASEFKQLTQYTREEGLNLQECNLLAAAYKSLVGAHRHSWRILQSLEERAQKEGNTLLMDLAQERRAVVRRDADAVCGEVLELLDTFLLAPASSAEAGVSLLKMKADFLRNLAEFRVGEERRHVADRSLAAYQAAQDKAAQELACAHHVRLGVALNTAVYYYDLMGQPEQACQVAQQAFDEALVHLPRLGGDALNDSARIMQLLRDNLTLWGPEMRGGGEGGAAAAGAQA
eukprot:CAMPEP_0202885708 /NCGR_PEP_ID=MMETSP1391-20130828/41801_1 /ASSEMBLY_ACC=CAM_ASM_000867 /TAXON_ID=1034604 /ORGANISM="Chlamydomonas leiostraca, Strain SAG 11-49" /LENGTH=320 /DNA_ID=CAMNT_0049568963 /DNA_START=373 /DNA_END=1335 /DNA_ORIENTATION=-